MIISDCFDNRLEPLSNSKLPQCLFSVANVPNLHYVIEFLLMNQIKEIIISSKHNRELIEEHTKKFKQQVKKIKVVATPDAENFGDSLRVVASMNLINDDFVIVRGDLISNINIHDALKMHYHIREEESKKENQTTETRKIKTIMTKLFLHRSNTNPLQDPMTEITVMLDKQTKEILKYQSLLSEHNRKQVKSIHVNEEHMPFLKSYAPPLVKSQQWMEKDQSLKCNNKYPNGSSIVIRQDLIDCEIAICTSDVLDHFGDNFDKANFKDGFINWTYESEIIEHRMRAFEIEQQGSYVARIFNPRTYN